MAAAIFLGSFSQDATLALLATLGISSLFLFAGLEIDLQDFRRGKWPLLGHLAMRALMLVALGYLAMRYLGFTWQVAVLLGLAVLTPSTGFILDTLPTLDHQRRGTLLGPHEGHQRRAVRAGGALRRAAVGVASKPWPGPRRPCWR